MGYEINVSKNGAHYFATAERSIGYDSQLLLTIYRQLKVAFPEKDGYVLSVSQREVTGKSINMNVIEKSVKEDWISGRLHYLKNTHGEKSTYNEILKLVPENIREMQSFEIAKYMVTNNITHPKIDF